MGSAIKFKHTEVARQVGETGRLKVVHGPDLGAVFILMGPKATLGRGEDNDVVISDLKASRNHAEIYNTPRGWMIKDKGSANGILHNGKQAREGVIRVNDTFTLGDTTLEFISAQAATQVLMAPARSLTQVLAEQKSREELRARIAGGGLAAYIDKIISPKKAAPPPQVLGSAQPRQNRTVILLVLVVGGGIYLFLPDGNNPKVIPPKKEESDSVNLAAYLPNTGLNKTAEVFYKEGFREFMDGNYNRARTQFETVLQISPGHPLATLYLENCQKVIEAEVSRNLSDGKRSHSAGKLREAKAHYERVLRLMSREPTNPKYSEAKEALEKVLKAMTSSESTDQ